MLMKTLKFMLVTLSVIFSLNANATTIESLFHQKNDPATGSPLANITVVEFFDYQCSHCVNMSPVISEILKSNKNVRVVFKEYPIRGPESELAARAALAANMQGKYYEYYHALMTTNAPIDTSNLIDIAKSLGLNVDKFKTDMTSKTVRNQIRANYALANALNVSGTPAFFIGKTNAKNSDDVKFVLGEMSRSELQDAISHTK